MMKKLPILVLLLALAGYAQADVASDIAEGVSMDVIVQNALAEDVTLEEIVAQVKRPKNRIKYRMCQRCIRNFLDQNNDRTVKWRWGNSRNQCN